MSTEDNRTKLDGRDKKAVLALAAKLEAAGFRLLGNRVAFIRDTEETEIRNADGKLLLVKPQTAVIAAKIVGRVLWVGEDVETTAALRPGMRCTFEKYQPTVHELEPGDGKAYLAESLHTSNLYWVWED